MLTCGECGVPQLVNEGGGISHVNVWRVRCPSAGGRGRWEHLEAKGNILPARATHCQVTDRTSIAIFSAIKL